MRFGQKPQERGVKPCSYPGRVFQEEETKHAASSERHSSQSDSTVLISLLSPEKQMASWRPTLLPLSTHQLPTCFSSGHTLLYCPLGTRAPSTCPSLMQLPPSRHLNAKQPFRSQPRDHFSWDTFSGACQTGGLSL